MTENKKQRLVSAATATSVIILFLLVVILVYQLISIGVKVKTKSELIAEIGRLSQEIEESEEDVELWQQEWKIEERARQLDYVYSKDKNEENNE